MKSCLLMQKLRNKHCGTFGEKVGEAVKAFSTYKEEDTVVPRYRLPELLEHVKKIGAKYGFDSVCYGHAGDGNLHVNILKGDLSA
jgi:glycolate oxidase